MKETINNIDTTIINKNNCTKKIIAHTLIEMSILLMIQLTHSFLLCKVLVIAYIANYFKSRDIAFLHAYTYRAILFFIVTIILLLSNNIDYTINNTIYRYFFIVSYISLMFSCIISNNAVSFIKCNTTKMLAFILLALLLDEMYMYGFFIIYNN